jgi:hypothetical protein
LLNPGDALALQGAAVAAALQGKESLALDCLERLSRVDPEKAASVRRRLGLGPGAIGP